MKYNSTQKSNSKKNLNNYLTKVNTVTKYDSIVFVADAPQQYIPPSEQQVQEPRKYTGGAIPSRSFRMLQAMTASPHPAGQSPPSHLRGHRW